MSSLPFVTDEDLALRPEQLRKTPRGGWAWKCEKCGQFASSLTATGLRCYQHGGTRKSTCDPLAAVKAQAEGEEAPRASGRPMKTGWYSREEMRNVHDIVEEYRAADLDPDSTDEDMLHLRARLQNLQNLEPTAAQVGQILVEVLEELNDWREQRVVEADGLSVEGVLEKLGRYQHFVNIAERGSKALSKYLSLEKGIEARHTNLVNLSHKRADTRVKNKAAEQLDVFQLMLGRLMLVLQAGLSPEAFLALQRRMERDLLEIPARALQPATITVAADGKPKG